MLVSAEQEFLPRYFHMMTGALAVGGLFVALLGQFRRRQNPDLAEHAADIGLKTFFYVTLINAGLGIWYLISLPRQQMLLFMGRDLGATIVFVSALALVIGVLAASYRRKLALTLAGTVLLVYLMSFMRSWLRTDLLADFYNLSQLQVVPQYSSMVLFLVCLVGGVITVGWLIAKTAIALKQESGG